MKKVTLYTDGACSGNPGPGGYGAVLIYNGVEKEISGGQKDTTNNQMEMMAVIKGLDLKKKFKEFLPVKLVRGFLKDTRKLIFAGIKVFDSSLLYLAS